MAYRKMTVRWGLTGEDTRQTSYYFNTGGAADNEDDIEAAFDALWTTLKPYYVPQLVLDEYRWYFSAALVPRGSPWGEADREIDRNVPGTSPSAGLPPQLAAVVSYPRPSPHKRHPGRNYFPAPATNALGPGGIIAVAFRDALANASETFLEACVAVGYQPVTIARIQGVDAALIIPKLAVDDVFDTQRRRGFEDWFSRVEREVTTIP